MSARVACVVLSLVSLGMVAFGGEGAAADAGKIKVLVVSGGHGFQEPQFFKMFEDNPDITFIKASHAKTSEVYEREDLPSFDVVVLYDLWQNITDAQKAKFLGLFEKGTGLVVLHHALADYQAWPEFEKAVGGKFFLAPEKKDGVVVTPQSGTGGGELALHIVSKEHPVTAGMEDFKIRDEYYNKCRVDPGVTKLVTTENPGNQPEVAWCREQGKSRVVYIMSGHDQQVYNTPTYRKLLANAIRWAARK